MVIILLFFVKFFKIGILKKMICDIGEWIFLVFVLGIIC